ncbi:hypothetical protein GCM10022243_34320 [Saccharothrix violaceirubra]|uniref:Outer membrane protein OmpA-like peptidoglycan-associated protein n=1 Tax=Saccharothrix violaceirubra TaxID=413306 RepID=A0A7W7WXD1_9PSEU|nr:OmpA family protein [Saccharothrix violaceirubra]MBB4966483.1 outer membrane protein OmpA-like peptidoglycan-associated protein [Saccharothrix violaceirubra]
MRAVTGPVVAVTLGLSAVACGGTEERPTGGSVAYVLGVHANAPAAASTSVLDDAVSGQAKLTVVLADGEPKILVARDLTAKAANDDAKRKEREDRKKELRGTLSQARPAKPEVDLLAAIDLGARSLDREPRRMVVESSGLSTTGSLSFLAPGMVLAEPEEIADDLQRKKLLPALGGVTVRLRGIGDTEPPQPRPGIHERSNLVAIWREVLTRAGATVEVDDQPRTGKAPDDAPAVSLVPLTPVTVAAPKAEETVPLPASAFFVADKAELLDRAAAVDALRPFAEHVKQAGGRIDLVGTTARVGDKEGQVALSGQRAEALRVVLVDDLGVPADRVTSSGVGSYHADYVADHDAEGNLLPDKAALNRTVRITIRR